MFVDVCLVMHGSWMNVAVLRSWGQVGGRNDLVARVMIGAFARGRRDQNLFHRRSLQGRESSELEVDHHGLADL